MSNEDAKIINPPPQSAKHTKSKAELIFDWVTYGGIGGLGTFGATIPIAYWAKYGGGAKTFESAVQGLKKMGMSTHTAEQFMITNATMQGGNAMVLPIKWAEDNKVEIVKKIADMIGEKIDVNALECENKQTWGSIIKARIAAWTAVFTGFQIAGRTLGAEKFTAFEDKFAAKVCQTFGKETHHLGVPSKTFNYGKIVALDLFATAAATTLLYVASRMFAPARENGDEEKMKPPPLCTEPIPDITSPSFSQQIQKTSAMHSKQPSENFADFTKRQSELATTSQLSA